MLLAGAKVARLVVLVKSVSERRVVRKNTDELDNVVDSVAIKIIVDFNEARCTTFACRQRKVQIVVLKKLFFFKKNCC